MKSNQTQPSDKTRPWKNEDCFQPTLSHQSVVQRVGRVGLGLLLAATMSVAIPERVSAQQVHYARVGQVWQRPLPLQQDSAVIRMMYRDLLHREPIAGEVESWIGALSQGMTREQVAASIVESDEHRGVIVQGYYSQFLGRNALPGEGADWVDRLREGYSRQDVIKGFVQSEEFMRRTGGTAQGFIDLSFRTILKRPPTRQDIADWMNRTAAENIHESLPNALLNSAEYFQRLTVDYYTAYLHRRPEAAVVGGFPSAVQQWLDFLTAGGNPEQLQIALLTSPEYLNLAVKKGTVVAPRPRF